MSLVNTCCNRTFLGKIGRSKIVYDRAFTGSNKLRV